MSRARPSSPADPAERVRTLVRSGRVATEEGERILSALDDAPRAPLHALLINPFDRFGGGRAAIAAIVIAGLSIGITRMGIRFDGFLDMHVGPVPLGTAALEQAI